MTDCYICLAANKIDMVEQRVVSSEQGMLKAQEIGVNYYECTAKNYETISAMVQIGVDWLIKNQKLEEIKK